MAMSRTLKGMLAGCLLLAVGSAAGAQAPTVEIMLEKRFDPKQKDIAITTLSDADKAACKVNAIAGTRPGSTGWELVDGKGQSVRRYFGAKGAKGGVDTWCYFKDGVEVYREIDSKNAGHPDQFRWFNTAGLKWGKDLTGKGQIDTWAIISAEEVGHEAFLAVANNDFHRLQTLFITEDEMKAMKLPAKEVDRLKAVQAQARKKFDALVKALPSVAGAKFERVESATPGCVPGESVGASSDLIKFASRAILYTASNSKHEWLHTGELIQVGFAWRLVDVPSVEDPIGPGLVTPMPGGNPKLADVIARIQKLEKEEGALSGEPLKKHLDARLALVMEAISLADAKEQDIWYKQAFDNLGTLAQLGEATAFSKLSKLAGDMAKARPGSSVAAYGVYRQMWADYSRAMSDPKITQAMVEKIQAQWLDQLEQFVKAYPKAEDTTPDALHQLAMHTEFLGNKDDIAKKWYEQVYTNFPEHYLAEKCKGAVRRIDLPGKKMAFAAPMLQTGASFDVASIKDKIVVVYFWDSKSTQCVGDFARLNKIGELNPGKMELVTVSLDDTAEHAKDFLKGTTVKGIHLYEAPPKGASGMSSTPAIYYGINGLPTVFMVGRDGRVLTRALQFDILENELKKAQ